MHLRVKEVAELVGRNDSFVRQHIRRGHLRVEREGRSVLIAAGEAQRWARDRDLTLNEDLFAAATARRAGTTQQVRDQRRMARVRIVAVRDGGEWKNVLTTIRCRYGSRKSAFSALDH